MNRLCNDGSFVFRSKRINEEFDVIVVGGGLAGTMAAISAARERKRVLLIEKYGCLGGMATSGMIYPFMRDRENGSGKRVNAGLFLTMLNRICEAGGSNAPESLSCNSEILKIVLDRMVREAGVKVLFHSRLCHVETENGEVRSVDIATGSGVIRLYGKTFVDATGNAELCAFAGMRYRMGREEDSLCQPLTLCFRLTNVDHSRFDLNVANALFRRFREEGKLRNPRENMLAWTYTIGNVLHLNATRAFVKDPTDVEEVSEAEAELREQAYELFGFLRKNIPGMENCEWIASPVEAGIRESRRIVGLKQITAEDILGVRKFEDSVARGAYAIDIHDPSGTGTIYHRIPPCEYYTIPYGALIPAGSRNVIVAGRAISTTHEALSAVRVMPITTCMGEAAGIAAAMTVEGDLPFSAVEVSTLREKITKYGGLV